MRSRSDRIVPRRFAGRACLVPLAFGIATACSTGVRTTDGAADRRRVEATSLLGRPLLAPELSDAFRAEQEGLLRDARAVLASHADDVDALIWVGRRTAYLGRYREAIEIYGRAIELHPDDPRPYRHRGHRFITTRRLDRAIRDLERAAALMRGRPDEIEPDGLPNERNIPTSTLHSNVWYHLGLARYLRGEFAEATTAYRRCLEVSKNPDMLAATSHWLFMTLRRSGHEAEAAAVLEPIHAGMDIIENHDYFRLLLMYKGESRPDELLEAAVAAESGVGFATLAYGVGNWHLYHGNERLAAEIFERILASDSWAAFGFIAAEAELARARR